jgi:hypothetical protein
MAVFTDKGLKQYILIGDRGLRNIIEVSCAANEVDTRAPVWGKRFIQCRADRRSREG